MTSQLSSLLVLLSIVTSNIYMANSYTLTASVLNQKGYNTQSTNININDNGIDSIDPNAFNGYTNLNFLLIASENIQTIDLEAFKGAVNIIYIWLDVPSLNKFTNSKNIIFPLLTNLYFSTNLTTLNKPMFNAFPSLNFFTTGYFDYSSNIKTIDVHTFESLSNLNYLDLQRNSLTGFEYLQIPKNLKQLYLTRNNMNYFALSRTMGVLDTLDISYNRFRSFKSMDFTFLANLTILYLNDNPHAYPNEIPGHLKPLVKLQYVYLGNLSISSIDSNYFKYNTKIKEINLMQNKISSLDSGAFNGLNDLKAVSLRENNLVKISSGTFSSIEVVYLSYNQISQIDDSSFLGNFMQVDLSYNNITKLSRPFSNTFRSIDLSYNQITELDNLTFAGVSQINELYLHNNKIEVIKVGSFNHLNMVLINLISNSLTELNNMIFVGQNQLQYIYLRNNSLSTIESGTFANLPNLLYVNLENNQLTQLDSSMFAGSNNLLGIFINGNPNLSTANIQSLCPPAATNCHVYYY